MWIGWTEVRSEGIPAIAFAGEVRGANQHSYTLHTHFGRHTISKKLVIASGDTYLECIRNVELVRRVTGCG